MKGIDKRILKLYDDHKQKEKIIIHLRNIEELIERRKAEIASLAIRVDKEAMDVQKLESLNLFSLFQKVLGDHEEQLERERQEFLQAVLQHKGAVENLNSLEEEKDLVKRMISGKFSVASNLAKLLKEKENWIMRMKQPEYELVFDFAERLAGHRSKVKEIQQAIQRGKQTQSTLDEISKGFKTIERWHGGMDRKVSERTKTQLRRIGKNIMKANNKIQHFYEELLDLHDHFEMDYEGQIKRLKEFLKELVDSMITDWVIKRKLENSIHLISGMHDKISLMISMLELEAKKTEEYIGIEELDKKELIVKLIKENKDKKPVQSPDPEI